MKPHGGCPNRPLVALHAGRFSRTSGAHTSAKKHVVPKQPNAPKFPITIL